jgi:hypothetical protein
MNHDSFKAMKSEMSQNSHEVVARTSKLVRFIVAYLSYAASATALVCGFLFFFTRYLEPSAKEDRRLEAILSKAETALAQGNRNLALFHVSRLHWTGSGDEKRDLEKRASWDSVRQSLAAAIGTTDESKSGVKQPHP